MGCEIELVFMCFSEVVLDDNFFSALDCTVQVLLVVLSFDSGFVIAGT